MSLFNNNAIHNYIVETEKSSKEIDRRIAESDYNDSIRGLQDIQRNSQALNSSAETQKYKDLYTKMLAKNNANIREKNQFNADMQLPFKQLFAKRGELLNIKVEMEELEEYLTSWMIQQKGAKQVAIEFGANLGKSEDFVENLIIKKSLDVIDNKLPEEMGNNLNQSPNPYLTNPDHQGIVSDYSTRISRVKEKLIAKLK